MPARHARAPTRWCWTTTWKSWHASPGRFPGRPRWPKPAPRARSPRAHEAFWALCRSRLGDADGTRMLVQALLLHRHLPHADMTAGLAAAVKLGVASADVVAVEARRAYEQRRAAGQVPAAMTPRPPAEPFPTPLAQPPVASLTQRRLASLPTDTRPPPSVAAYDELLTRTPGRTS